MRLELRKIEHAKSLSEETPAYTAQVWVDGVHFCDVANHGQGGCDMQYAPKDKREGFEQRLADLQARIKEEFPPVKSEYFEEGMEMDLELWCHIQLDEVETVKALKRSLSNSILFVKEGKLYAIGMSKVAKHQRTQYVRMVKDAPNHKGKGYVYLNDLTIEEALVLYKKHG